MAETNAPARGRRPARSQEAEQEAAGPQPCSACRATGRVFANRDGGQIDVPCPWCQGTGEWQPGYDAQAAGTHPAA